MFRCAASWVTLGAFPPAEFAQTELLQTTFRTLVSNNQHAVLHARKTKPHTAISRKVDGKSARNNPKRYCRWFWVLSSSKKFERMAREAVDICLRVVKESNKSRFESYSFRNTVLIISLITFRECCMHIFFDNLSRNSCILIINGVSNHGCQIPLCTEQTYFLFFVDSVQGGRLLHLQLSLNFTSLT